jgi:RNA polymerase sigma-70 factor (ECF subfamily)
VIAGASEESGLDEKPRRVPDERAATGEEVRAAVAALGEADLVRLERFARYRVRGLSRRACGRTHEDLLHEAVTDTLDPQKRRWNKNVSFASHLIGAMRSISSHWGEQFNADEPRLESELVRTSAEGDPSNPMDSVGSDSPGADRIADARQQLEQIENAVAGDRILSDILGGMRAEMLPSEICEVLGLSRTEYETAVKRLRRHVRPRVQGGSDG